MIILKEEKTMKRQVILLFIIFMLWMIPGCQNQEGENKTMNSYQTITASQALEKMQNEEVTILDVRTAQEYQQGHIPNAILLPYDQINQQAETILLDKEAMILVYCRSGRRSSIAAQALAELGYQHIYDFGGIQSWTGEITNE